MYPTPPDSPDGPSDTEGERGERGSGPGIYRESQVKGEEEQRMLGLKKVWMGWGLLQKASCQFCWANWLQIRVYLFLVSSWSPSSLPETEI